MIGGGTRWHHQVFTSPSCDECSKAVASHCTDGCVSAVYVFWWWRATPAIPAGEPAGPTSKTSNPTRFEDGLTNSVHPRMLGMNDESRLSGPKVAVPSPCTDPARLPELARTPWLSNGRSESHQLVTARDVAGVR